MIVILALPILGAMLYLTLGNRKTGSFAWRFAGWIKTIGKKG